MTETSNWSPNWCSLDFPANGFLAYNYCTKSSIMCLPIMCLVLLLSCCSQVYNGTVECIAWMFRYWHQESSVCSLQHKAYVRALLNRNQHAIWAIWDSSGPLLRDWLLLMAETQVIWSCWNQLYNYPVWFFPFVFLSMSLTSLLKKCLIHSSLTQPDLWQNVPSETRWTQAGTECYCVWVCVARV